MATHLAALKRSQPIRKPVYDFSISDRVGWSEPIRPGRVVVLEGLLLFALPELREQLDVKIFVDTDADIRILRRIKRDVIERGRTIESVEKQYVDTVKPMHELYVQPSKHNADIIVPEGGENQVAIDILVTKVRDIISKTNVND